jgi:cyclopropane fatty-acyl-phospholipid synthase-like methyltransferase
MKSPAAARNRQPIFDVLSTILPEQARILEVASGSGEHGVHAAGAKPGWVWQPSDPNPEARSSISAWREHAGLDNLCEPLPLDVSGIWPAGPFDAVVAINLVHISPWEVTEALMARSAQRLREGGVVYLYGPYRRDGRHTAQSNAAFDADLKARDPSWGVRDLERVVDEAQQHGFMLEQTIAMPANNFSVVLRLHS